MKKTKTERSLLRLSAAAMLAGVMVLAGCSGGGDQPPVDTSVEDAAADRKLINDAIDTAQTAVDKVDDASDAATVTAADNAVAAATSAIASAAHISAEEKAAHNRAVTAIASQLTAAKKSRTAKMDDDQKAIDAAMVALALKLHTGISAPTTESPTPATDTRFAGYGSDDNANNIRVRSKSTTNIFLTEDKKATIAVNHGWDGKKYTRTTPASEGTYEAVVYSNVGEPTDGRKFASTAAVTDGGAYEYQLNATNNTELAINTGTADTTTESEIAVQKRIKSTEFDQTAGTKEFKGTRVDVDGSYHGVSGKYYCTPSSSTVNCGATISENGFALVGGTWTFLAGSNEARVMSTPDNVYASYGWWIHKSSDDKTYTASAFEADKGAVPDASGITVLRGTATYTGGAAGHFALTSSTGGTNDAGQFTADAMLNADFDDDTITGTIDSFMGADGKSRDWSVELKEASISDEGVISRSAANDTVWTIGTKAADASGEWSGRLQENNAASGVPGVGTGTFYTEYGLGGKMVGGFGVNSQ